MIHFRRLACPCPFSFSFSFQFLYLFVLLFESSSFFLFPFSLHFVILQARGFCFSICDLLVAVVWHGQSLITHHRHVCAFACSFPFPPLCVRFALCCVALSLSLFPGRAAVSTSGCGARCVPFIPFLCSQHPNWAGISSNRNRGHSHGSPADNGKTQLLHNSSVSPPITFLLLDLSPESPANFPVVVLLCLSYSMLLRARRQ